ncbi:MAG TPA: hypothetical protein VF817_02965 [Patescibacteria group bacterium]
MTQNQAHDEANDLDKAHRIEALRQMILNAEKTMQSAKAMLLQLEGKKKTGRKRKTEEEADGTVIEGTFDGQIMLGTDGKQYPVPANYASKSKLVEGDMLKLTITSDGSFVYKQIGPAARKNAIGIVSQDERGNYFIFCEGKPYKVLLASITYFKAEPGDEVTIMIPREIDATWAAIENVLQKGSEIIFKQPSEHAEAAASSAKRFPSDGGFDFLKSDQVEEEKTTPISTTASSQAPATTNEDSLMDEWTSDIADLEKEIKAQGI